ncbi:glycosyltransferase [Brevibacterium permense]|uniref:glycosyltransferase n=1 Tax=Brevibacterium permense TaxID=234834 RepID=UPI0021CEF058|nr:glycosyltransferase [Brevibacterium permense]MCU4297615.1 glycosyltransferase [Brevibacterium permense]
MNRTPSPALPDLPFYTLTWAVGEQYGGITMAALQRTFSFAEITGRKMEFLTVDPLMDPKLRRQQLMKAGRISKLVVIRNMWDELRKMRGKDLRKLRGNVDAQLEVDTSSLLNRSSKELLLDRTDDDGKTCGTDYFRCNGTVVVSNQRMIGNDGKRVQRFTLFSKRGKQLAQWSNLSELYFAWLDFVIKDRESVLILDSPGIGSRMRFYERKNVVRAQVLHNYHLADPIGAIDSSISPRYKNIIVNSDRYEVIGVLTEDQRRDLDTTQLNPGNLAVLSNMYQGEVVEDPQPRPKYAGVQLSRLTAQKRIDHTIRAVATSNNATVDIYGFAYDERDEQKLHKLIESLGVSDRVRLQGYDSMAREHFKEASFSLLPSLYEGQGLVLIESMAAGCIPIAYDIRYGPSSIIDHGVNGFLVPGGDVDALAATIDHVTSLDDETLIRMRRAGVARAREYLPTSMVPKWGDVLRGALNAKRNSTEHVATASALEAKSTAEGLRIVAEIEDGDVLPDWAAIAWKSRTHDLYGRVAAAISSQDGRVSVESFIPSDRLLSLQANIFDFYVDARFLGKLTRMRITVPVDSVLEVSDALAPYATISSNLSVKAHAQEDAKL